MEKMNKSTPKPNKNSVLLGKKDLILDYQSKWLIYKLNLFDKKGLWLKFKNKLNELQEKNMLRTISEDDLLDFSLKNSDIEFEILAFEDIMQKHNLFKINNIIYSYSDGKKTKNTKNITYVRFYFELEEFFNY
jgi:hypothetical protein